VVADDDTITPALYRFDRVLGALDSLEQERAAVRQRLPLLDQSVISALALRREKPTQESSPM